MRLDALQQMRLEQKLRLAPKMIQSMEILQLPLAALEERIEQELEKNPTLEQREESLDPADRERDSDATADRELVVAEDNSNREDFERLDNLEHDLDPFEFSDSFPTRSRASSDEDPKHEALSNTAAREGSLHDYLVDQWHLVDADPAIRECGERIINNLDPDGYLRTPFAELDAKMGQAVGEATWEAALRLVQELDPPGVAARTLQECLLLQLDALGEDRPLERRILRDFSGELEKQHYSKIAAGTGRDLEEIKQAVEFIRTRLLPHPGLTVGAMDLPHVVPDVIIDYDEEKEGYKVTVADDRLPPLAVSRHYRKLLQSGQADRDTRKFIRSNIQSAQWLLEAIEQRRHTLKRVTECIVEAQEEFFENGPQYLRPLPMADVAEKIGVHVATVSRTVAGKYALTPRGIYPLRSFFSGGTETKDGESMSWEAVRAKIQQIIDAEDKRKPLTDDEIKDELAKLGIELARRTVVKYRKQMDIGTSRQRRER